MVEEEKIPLEREYFDDNEARCKLCGWRIRYGAYNSEPTQHAILHKLTDLLDILEDVKHGNAVFHVSQKTW